MSDKSSFDVINYSIRPNKNIERKLIIDSIKMMESIFDYSTYRYIGMGSLWFIDFMLAHKLLNIDKMISIEKPEYESRVEFNKPYNCISIEAGDTSSVLPSLELDKHRDIIWLDYDSNIIDDDVLEDMQLVLERAKIGSIFLVTVNAHVGQLNRRDEKGKTIDKTQLLREHLGNLISPNPLPRGTLQKANYPSFLAKKLFEHAKSVMNRSGRKERFFQLFDYFYRDGAPMITIGGVITDDDLADKIKSIYDSGDNFSKPHKRYCIETPPLTIKEKSSIDVLFPCDNVPTETDIENIGFNLKQEQIDSYAEYYKLYPLFAELNI